MEEAIGNALQEAGDFLSKAIRVGLISKGLPQGLRTELVNGRVVITSGAPEVDKAERGVPLDPPSAPMEAAARDATTGLLSILQQRLQEICRERGL